MRVVKHGNMYENYKMWWYKYKTASVFCPECGVEQELCHPKFPFSCGCGNCGCRFEIEEKDVVGVK